MIMIGDHATQASPGMRQSTPAARRAMALAERYAGLDKGVTRWRLAAALRAAARPLGLSAGMLRLLEHYIDLTYDQDWEAGAEPVITRPLVEIADYLGRSTRQVRNIERALTEKGLLSWRDSGNHHRKGRRDQRTGRLIYAYGPSLAPLGARADEIIACAAAARAELAAARRLRLAISALRRRIRAELAVAQMIGVDVTVARAQFEATPPRIEAGLGLAALKARRDALAALAAATSALLPAAADEAQQDAPATTIAAEAEIPGRHNTDTSHRDSINGYGASSAGKPEPVAATPLPLAVALSAAGPGLKEALRDVRANADGPTTWQDLHEAAARMTIMLGVSRALWGDSCRVLGRDGAALAVLLVERGALRPARCAGAAPIRHPCAYLRGMLARAETRQLHMARSVRAWAARDAAGK